MSLSATFSVSVPTTDQVLARIKDRLLVAVGQESGAGFTFIECVALVAAVSCFQSTIALGEPKGLMKRGTPQGLKYASRRCPDCGRWVKDNYFARHQRSKCVLGGHDLAPASIDHTGLVNQDEAATIADMAPSTFRWYAGQAEISGQREGSTIWYTAAEVRAVTGYRQSAIRRRIPHAAPRPATACAICGQSLQHHPRCRACGILLGPGHDQGEGPLCVGCRPQPPQTIADYAHSPSQGVHCAGPLPRFGRPGAGGSGE